MGQTKEGAVKARQTILDRYGVTPDGKSKLHQRIGAVGGKKTGIKGFALNKALAIEAGRKGGTISRRGKAIK